MHIVKYFTPRKFTKFNLQRVVLHDINTYVMHMYDNIHNSLKVQNIYIN